MKEHKTIVNGFTWVPIEKRKSRFGGKMPPGKPEKRLPILWLARDGSELYLVNASREPLDYVVADSGGCQTVDDDIEMVSSKEKYEYKDVKPDDAVKVDEFDVFYDCDYMLQVFLTVQSASLGCVEIASPLAKGGVGETVLLWDSGESGKDVSVKRCQEA